jgi:hypothetical protein
MPKGGGFGRGLGGRGRMGGTRAGAGPRGVPCNSINCPGCGTKMVRE